MQARHVFLSFLILSCALSQAQSAVPSVMDLDGCSKCLTYGSPDFFLPGRPAPPMSQELTLSAYHRRAARQAGGLTSYDMNTIVDAVLPDTMQQGRFELRTQYTAPATLRFTPLRFTGDRFVRSHIINRYLQAEVQHVEKRDSAATAINLANYNFSYKRTETTGGRVLHVYAVKPRRKAPGLFKGEITLDASTGSLRRAKGAMVKSPSFFIRKIEFEQDYEDVKDLTVPIHLHSKAKARLVGRVVIDVTMRDYSLLAQNDEPMLWLPSVN